MEVAADGAAQSPPTRESSRGLGPSCSRTRWNSSSSSMHPAMSPRVCSSRRTISPRRVSGRPGSAPAPVESERLQGDEDGADIPELGRVERREPEPSPRVGSQKPFAGEALKRLPHRGSADSQLGGDRGIPILEPGVTAPR